MRQSKILEIGPHAIDKKENILIFFGEHVTAGLRPYSVIQEMSSEDVELAVGDKILFGEQEYRITYVGNHANKNLQAIQHISFVFSDVPTDKLSSTVYLTPTEMPEITEGMLITYKG